MDLFIGSFRRLRGVLPRAAAPLVAFALLFGSESLLAATRTWTGNGLFDFNPANRKSWTNGLNWSGNNAPQPGDDLVFPSASVQTESNNNFGAGTSFGKITIENHTLTGANIVLTGGISATGGQINLNKITVNTFQTITVPNAAQTLVISSPIELHATLSIQGSGTLVFSGAVSGGSNIHKKGDGVVSMTANNTLSQCSPAGTGGTFAMNGSSPSTVVSVAAGDTFVGIATVRDIDVVPTAVGLNAAVAPGNNGPGILSLTGELNYFPGSGPTIGKGVLEIDINGSVAGTGYDQLKVAGEVILRTGAELRVVIGGNFTPAAGETFTIIKNDGPGAVFGKFAALEEGTLFTVGATTFQISYAGGDGNDVALTVIPGTVKFSIPGYAVDEDDGTALIRLTRTGGGATTARVAVTLRDITTTPADYISPAGKLDGEFDAAVNSLVGDIEVLSDGKILIAGTFTAVQGTSRGHIARLNPDGTLDTSFTPAGANNDIRAMAVLSDGKIMIGGTFTTYNGTGRNRIARLNADGSLDTTFNPGTGLDESLPSIEAIEIQDDGKIVIAGFFSSYNGTPQHDVARINPNGSLDTSLVADVFSGNILSMTLQRDGKILVGGVFSNYGSAAAPRIARLNSNGSLDSSFAPGTGPNSNVTAVTVQEDGGIIIGGAFSTYNGTARKSIARLLPTGALDTSFDPGAGANFGVEKVFVQPDTRLLVGGRFTEYDGIPRNRIARLESNGKLDLSFDPGSGASSDGTFNSPVLALAMQPDGRFLVGGFFGKFNGVPIRNLVRLQGDLVAVWGPNDFADKTVLLPIVNDAIFEGNETLGLRLVPLNAALKGTPSAVELTIFDNDVSPAAKAVNISTRLRAETGDNVMIAGFIITGNTSKNVVLRGMGPLLGNFGIAGFLADPVVDLRGPGGPILVNNNWKDTQRAQIEGTAFQPGDDRESVIMATLPPASYTAILTGNNNTTGVGLIEVYDNNSPSDSQLGNISTRGLVQGSDSVMIGGFILGGNTGASRIAIRGIGPSLALFGLNNVLTNPTLDLRDANGAPLISNDDWESDATSAAQLRANSLALSDPKEAGIFATLAPGPFTAILAGKDGGSGIGLIEIFNLQ